MVHVTAVLYMTARIVFVLYLLSLTGMRRLARADAPCYPLPEFCFSSQPANPPG
jgi:hypothetical protein